jgi:hypothetical protein
MALPLKEKKLGTLILVVLVGIIIGTYINAFVLMLPGGDNVVKTFFTYTIPFGVGGFDEKTGVSSPVIVDLYAVRFQFGFQFRFSLLSILGIFLSLYFFRWYK